jgi:hypothetical protein
MTRIYQETSVADPFPRGLRSALGAFAFMAFCPVGAKGDVGLASKPEELKMSKMSRLCS